MEVKTKLSVGDRITVNGSSEMIVGIHVYIGKDGITSERAWLTSGEWLTISRRNENTADHEDQR